MHTRARAHTHMLPIAVVKNLLEIIHSVYPPLARSLARTHARTHKHQHASARAHTHNAS